MNALFAESNINSVIETSIIIYAYSKLGFIGCVLRFSHVFPLFDQFIFK